MQKDYYQILSVIETAELAVIKATYKTLIHLYHPDRYEGDKDEAHQKTIDILEAYRVLSNPALRDEYDRLWARGRYNPNAQAPQTPPASATVARHKLPRFDPDSMALSFSGHSDQRLMTHHSESALKLMAKVGDIDAQMELARRYFVGQGLEQSYQEAYLWFRRAAEQEAVQAQTVLGFMYANGLGTHSNEIKACLWFRRAAEQGDHDAQFRLGLCYYAGFGVEQDFELALNWLSLAENQGNSNAQYLLGFMYQQGEGVSANLSDAIVWYRKAAANGNRSAAEELAELLVA